MTGLAHDNLRVAQQTGMERAPKRAMSLATRQKFIAALNPFSGRGTTVGSMPPFCPVFKREILVSTMIFDSSHFLSRLPDVVLTKVGVIFPGGCPRDSPPRRATRPPTLCFVSEAMLQQTQVSTVVPYFNRFLPARAFPTVQSLAPSRRAIGAATLARVGILLASPGISGVPRRRLWLILRVFLAGFPGGAADIAGSRAATPLVPSRRLRMTAGRRFWTAMSLAFLCRIDRIESDPRERENAEQTLGSSRATFCRMRGKRVGDFNSALMELGATICTPAKIPNCPICPVNQFCQGVCRWSAGSNSSPSKITTDAFDQAMDVPRPSGQTDI